MAQVSTPQLLGAYTPLSDDTIPVVFKRPLEASAQVGRGQLATVNPATGQANLNDGTIPNQIAAGNGDTAEVSDVSAVAGNASVRVGDRFFYGLSMGTAGDAFTDADWVVPFYIGAGDIVGKLSNLSGNNRSLGGLVFGLSVDGTSPLCWSGPVAHALARATLMTQGIVGGSYQIATAAATDTAEVNMTREKLHGVVVGVDFEGLAVVASDTDNVTITISKRDLNGANAVTVATYSSAITGGQGAVTAFKPAPFVLSGTAANLNLLETDVLTITVTHAGAGKALTGNVRVIQKVI